MKKIIVLALLILPVTSFGASSVRVLGAKAAPASGSGVTAAPAPAKALPAKSATTNASGNSGSRIGTVRAIPKATTTAAGTAATTGNPSRFPVISPAHSYSSVTKPQTSGTTTVINPDLSNYYTKEEVDYKIEQIEPEEDPRVDMIHLGSKRAEWMKTHEDKVKELENDGYVFMWVEEGD